MKLPTLLSALFLVLSSFSSFAAGIGINHLVQTYSRDDNICKEVAAMLADDKACRPFDAIKCTKTETYSVNIRGSQQHVFEEVATNEYNYTEVFRSTEKSLNGFAIIYIQSFQGDQNPRLVETWKVDAADLEKVLKLPPGPWLYDKWIKMKPWPPRATNAVEFEAMLQHGEKLTDEWSPVIKIKGEPYLVERECSGTWAYGGFYACNKVTKLTIKKLAMDKKSLPYCQYAKIKHLKGPNSHTN